MSINISSNTSSMSKMISTTSGNTDQIKILEKQKVNLQKQLQKTEDDATKKQIEQQIQNIDTQILQKQNNSESTQSSNKGNGTTDTQPGEKPPMKSGPPIGIPHKEISSSKNNPKANSNTTNSIDMKI